MLRELDEMSIGQKLYDYECSTFGSEKEVQEFLIEEFREYIIFGFGAVASLEDESMPELACLKCGSEFKYKKTDNR